MAFVGNHLWRDCGIDQSMKIQKFVVVFVAVTVVKDIPLRSLTSVYQPTIPVTEITKILLTSFRQGAIRAPAMFRRR